MQILILLLSVFSFADEFADPSKIAIWAYAGNGNCLLFLENIPDSDEPYKVERAQDQNFGYQLVGAVTSMDREFIDQRVPRNSVLYYRVRQGHKISNEVDCFLR